MIAITTNSSTSVNPLVAFFAVRLETPFPATASLLCLFIIQHLLNLPSSIYFSPLGIWLAGPTPAKRLYNSDYNDDRNPFSVPTEAGFPAENPILPPGGIPAKTYTIQLYTLFAVLSSTNSIFLAKKWP
jgi:hypothetical protein